MKKVILTRGLPGSGKSTWAKQEMAENPGAYKRVSKDDLRAMLDDGKWSSNNEKFILKLRDQIILMALETGNHVIVDDTNMAGKHEVRIRDLVRGKAEVVIKDFTDVEPEICIERDLKRSNSVGSRVIWQMYNQFLRPKPEIIEVNPELPDAVIVDIDGTLALFGDANPYERDFSQDKVNRPIQQLLLDVSDELILVSGRMDKFREVTEKWLIENRIIYNHLFMRKTDDMRKDYIIKKEIFDNDIRGKFNIRWVADDRNQTVRMWRSLGFTCLQVAEGDF